MHGHWVGSAGHHTAQDHRQVKSTSAEQEQVLIAAWKQGDRGAGGKLIEAFLPFVVSIALEYRRWNAPMEDIVQQGCLGLLRASSRFDPEQHVRLVTYAAYWIRAEIRDYVLRSYRMVRLGTTKSERKAMRWYRTTLESDPQQLALASGLSVQRVEALLPLLSSGDISFEAASADGTGSFHDRLAANDPSPEECAIQRLDSTRAHSTILDVLAGLSMREQLIARERWLSETPTTLEALGSRLGVTKERVRQIEDRTRQKVRARLAERKVA